MECNRGQREIVAFTTLHRKKRFFKWNARAPQLKLIMPVATSTLTTFDVWVHFLTVADETLGMKVAARLQHQRTLTKTETEAKELVTIKQWKRSFYLARKQTGKYRKWQGTRIRRSAEVVNVAHRCPRRNPSDTGTLETTLENDRNTSTQSCRVEAKFEL